MCDYVKQCLASDFHCSINFDPVVFHAPTKQLWSALTCASVFVTIFTRFNFSSDEHYLIAGAWKLV